MVPIVSFVGASNSGKTTLLEKVIKALNKRGYRVAVVKHIIRGFELDLKGKDSWRLKRAGANPLILSSPERVTFIQDVLKEQSLQKLYERFRPEVDIIFTEGYKKEPYPKIEVFRKECCSKLLCTVKDNLIAVASDTLLNVDVPCLDINNTELIAEFIEKKYLTNKSY
ncbi:MAG: molybdopterin-guanine dinucleotide biosynthesis protein B [Spirochaetota bacterium]